MTSGLTTSECSPPLRYSADESVAANQLWRANCGPHSIAAALGLNLEQVRVQLVDFNGWMNPTNLGDALRRLGAEYTPRKGLKTKDLCNGINRVQWEGSWLNPGVPPAAAYAHTHWVAHLDGWVLCTATALAAWQTRHAWEAGLSNDDRRWHVTHHYRIGAQRG